MRIVYVHDWGNFEASGTDTLPLEYESPEAALIDFEKALHDKSSHTTYGTFTFAGHEFWSDNFREDGKFYLPEFLTIDEWFERGAQV